MELPLPIPMSTQPNVRSVLDAVSSKARLFEVARHFGVSVPAKGTRAELAAALARSEQVRFRSLIEWMGRDELRQACDQHGLSAESRARQQLAARLLEAARVPETGPPAALFGARVVERSIPRAGDIAMVRQRQYLVEGVVAPGAPDEATRVDLVCLDDDAQGRPLTVLWELELGARVLQPETFGSCTLDSSSSLAKRSARLGFSPSRRLARRAAAPTRMPCWICFGSSSGPFLATSPSSTTTPAAPRRSASPAFTRSAS